MARFFVGEYERAEATDQVASLALRAIELEAKLAQAEKALADSRRMREEDVQRFVETRGRLNRELEAEREARRKAEDAARQARWLEEALSGLDKELAGSTERRFTVPQIRAALQRVLDPQYDGRWGKGWLSPSSNGGQMTSERWSPRY